MTPATSTLDALRSIRHRVVTGMPDAEREALIEQAVASMPDPARLTGLETPSTCLLPLGNDIQRRYGPTTRGPFAAALMAHLALRLLPRLPEMRLPEGIIEEYPAAFDRLLAQLTSSSLEHYWTGDDFFLKDIRIAGGYSAPCHAVDVDLHATINRRTGLKSLVTQGDVRGGWRLMRVGGPTWFCLHTDTRNTKFFNEQGMIRAYLLLAALLRNHPGVKGIARTSWFVDPAIRRVSPRLAYLQQLPVDNGAFLVRLGPDPIHTERAIAKSESRRSMVEAGTYVPTGYSLVWPRQALLRWAESYRAAPP
jgi:hypothetical protein